MRQVIPQVLVCCWVLLSTNALAQVPNPDASVPASEIPERMQRISALVRAVGADVDPQPDIVEIERSLPDFHRGTTTLIAASRDLLRTHRSPVLLREMLTAWVLVRGRLQDWQRRLKQRSAALEEHLGDLERESKPLLATKERAAEQELPDEFVGDVDRLLAAISDSRAKAISRRNAILKMQALASGIGADLERVEEELRAATTAELGMLLSIDAPPIWITSRAVEPAEQVVRTPLESRPVAEIAKLYLERVLHVALAQAILFLCVLACLRLVRRTGSEWARDEDDTIRSVGILVKRPFSAALLLTLLIGALWHTQGPEFLQNLAWLVMLVPLFRVILPILPGDAAPAVRLVAALYTVDRLQRFLPRYATSTRVLVLLLAAVAIWGLLRLDRRLRKQASASTWNFLARCFTRVGIGVLAAAFAAEVVGATGLSRYLEDAVLRCAYAAAVLYGSLSLVRGMTMLVLRKNGSASETFGHRGLKPTLFAALNWLVLVGFIVLCFNAFQATDVSVLAIGAVTNHRVSIGAIDFTLGSVVTFVALLLLAALLSRMIRYFLASRLYGRMDLSQGAGEAISKLLHYSLLAAGFLFALGAAGIDMNKFTVLAGGLSVGIGFGMQNIIGNFVSGLILLFERPLHVGDIVTVGAASGEVKDIGIRASTIRTFQGADVVIPNGSLISGEFTNWTLSDQQRCGDIKVGVAYGSDPESVIRILKDTAATQPGVLGEPEPVALFTGFGESSLDFTLRYWTLLREHVTVTSRLHVALAYRLTREGIELPFPQRDLHLRDVDAIVLDRLRRETPTDDSGRSQAAAS